MNTSVNTNNAIGNPDKKDRSLLDFTDFLGISPAVQKVREQAMDAANDRRGTMILITGERGLGKDLIATAIHNNSKWLIDKNNFVEFNCANMEPGLIGDNLFGHTKGSFTSAVNQRHGLLKTANNGTLFINEFGNLNLESQGRFLEVIEYGKFKPIGSDKAQNINVRIIAATNKNLLDLCEKEKFMFDLYDRSSNWIIHIPALRERHEDIPVLAAYYAKKYAKDNLFDFIFEFDDGAINKLMEFDFPGNVRTLKNLLDQSLRRITKQNSNKIKADDIKFDLPVTNKSIISVGETQLSAEECIRDIIKLRLENNKHKWKNIKTKDIQPLFNYEFYRYAIFKCIYENSGENKEVAAKLLGITRNQLRKVKK